MQARVRTVVVAHDPFARIGLVGLLEDGGLEVAGHVAPTDVGNLVAELDPDLVVWDVGAEGPRANAPILALVNDEAGARLALQSGAVGVIERGMDAARVEAAARAVAQGLHVLDAAFASLVKGPPVQPPAPPGEPLSDRELEVLEYLAQGLSNPEIAVQLEISANTVKFHVKAILDKLGAQTRTEAVVLSLRAGLLTL